MIGGIITNYKIPSSRLQFLAIPLYSTGAKQLNGLGKLNYSIYRAGIISKVDFFLNASTFSMNSFEKENGDKVTARFQKLVPGIRLTLNQKNPRGHLQRYLQWKTFFLNEESFRISYDSIFMPPDTLINQSVNTVS